MTLDDKACQWHSSSNLDTGFSTCWIKTQADFACTLSNFSTGKLEIIGKWPVVHNVILMQSDFINFLLCESTSSLINEFAIGLLSTSWFDSIMQNQSMNICEHQAVKHVPDAHPTSIHWMHDSYSMNHILHE